MPVLIPDEVLRFWFEQIEPRQWWVKDADFDNTVRSRFGALIEAAAGAELWEWRRTPRGRLAEVIVLDQFSRNAFRDTPRAFSQDPLALALSQEAVAAGALLPLSPEERTFLLMPWMHSESRAVHVEAERLFREFAPTANFEFELKHKVIIDRFGRYPHRNAILGRRSTPEEQAFLQQPGSGF